MGIEFIRNASGKPYTKRWARGIDRIKAPTLMDVSISEESRTLTAKLIAKGAASRGTTVLVQSKGSDLVVFDGLRQIASIADAPPSVRAAVDARQGMAPAVVERIGILGATAEIKLK
ncbi:hypothetical protein TSA1_05755 [Bradyrhizobium nitroreducens]|uniref:Uncharacterized protein n=1 Tax=Bradyrhizobium nitroreducens TaxID=709803 RepID=A0A2M6U6W5_9BRAD|nr:hypothetical protein [Bradyrhizobium nitroreducens]PIT00322.1 hypothetical protein TSA1_05755 [Bradyrhizobium nitroreducens]